MPFSPLGKWFLTDAISDTTTFDATDVRKESARYPDSLQRLVGR